MSKENNATKIIKAYTIDEDAYNVNVPSLLKKYRHDAIAYLRLLGLPTNKHEDYKRCDISALFDQDFALRSPASIECSFSLEQIEGMEVISLVVVNGILRESLSRGLEKLPAGVFIGTLSALLTSKPERELDLERIYGRLAEPDIDGTIALNQLLAEDVLIVEVPDGVCVEHPIVVHHVAEANQNLLTTPRTIALIGDDAQANIIFLNHHQGEHAYIIDRVQEIVVGKRAKLSVFSLQRESAKVSVISNTILRIGEESRVVCDEFVFSKGVSRNNVRARFVGERAKLILNGLVVGREGSLIDNFTRVEHTRPECETDELYKYLVEDHAIASFAGRIFISQAAQKTFAYQQNGNLLLSPHAKVFSKPQLEIYADDVQCSHGMTTGQLDEEALFYMRQRGIPLEEARTMLSIAFAESVIERVDIPQFQEILRKEVHATFVD